MTSTTSVPLLEATNLKKHYSRGWFLRQRTSVVRAVDGVSVRVSGPGETIGIVGESGSGKSTTGRLLLGLEAPDSGAVRFDTFDIHACTRSEWRRYRTSVKAVFQDPFSSLDPRMQIGEIVAEPLARFGSPANTRTRVEEALTRVGLRASVAGVLPRELSGGMRQRVAVARAMITDPRLVVLDEPTSALDVSVRAQILNLLRDIGDATGVSYILISHELPTIRFMADDIYVMYAGQIVESATNEALFAHPLHPYTQGLLKSVLADHPRQRSADVSAARPVLDVPVRGCRFRNRCAFAMPRCAEEEPLLTGVAAEHRVACHLYPTPDAQPVGPMA
jgi:oligopeptide/dipeptide ABC transporter ATP-binding protein